MDIDINKLEVRHDANSHRFFIPLGDEEAEIEYALNEGRIIFLHTGVPPAYEGRGIASKLTKEALDYAKNNGLRVISLCSYISRYISRHPEYQPLQEVKD